MFGPNTAGAEYEVGEKLAGGEEDAKEQLQMETTKPLATRGDFNQQVLTPSADPLVAISRLMRRGRRSLCCRM